MQTSLIPLVDTRGDVKQIFELTLHSHTEMLIGLQFLIMRYYPDIPQC